jgi:hypothetical protein
MQRPAKVSPGNFRRNLLEKPEARDDSLVGITFVDVLFAIVVAQVLQPVARGFDIPAAGKAQLVVAFALTVTSWIGYHNSWNRPRFFIRFLNLPLAQFVIDVTLVIVYWLTATWVEGLPLESRNASALPEATLITISFVLYVLWDRVGYKIRTSDRYFGRPPAVDVPARRRVSGTFLITALVIWALIAASNPTSTGVVVAVDILLILVLVSYRLVKEGVTSPEARLTSAMPDEGTAGDREPPTA